MILNFTNTLSAINVEDVTRRTDTNVRAWYVKTSPNSTVVTATVTFINIWIKLMCAHAHDKITKMLSCRPIIV